MFAFSALSPNQPVSLCHFPVHQQPLVQCARFSTKQLLDFSPQILICPDPIVSVIHKLISLATLDKRL